ncbi:MAG: hypothetical protein ACI88H_003159 [Cocleimonas sp.]
MGELILELFNILIDYKWIDSKKTVFTYRGGYVKEQLRRIVIIGNGPIDKDYQEFVNRSECVVRFNLYDISSGNTGQKTDILFFTNTGGPARNGAKKKKLEKLECINNVTQVLFPYSPKNRIQNIALKLSGKRHLMEYGNKLVSRNQLFKQQVLFLGDAFVSKTWNKLVKLGDEGTAIMPSSGMLAIEHILNADIYKDAVIYLLGFSHQGTGPHPWELEKALCQQYAGTGRLIIE